MTNKYLEKIAADYKGALKAGVQGLKAARMPAGIKTALIWGASGAIAGRYAAKSSISKKVETD